MRLIHGLLIAAIVVIGVVVLNLNEPSESDAVDGLPKEPISNDYSFYDQLAADEVVITESNYTSTPKNTKLDKEVVLQIAAVKSLRSAETIQQQLINLSLSNVFTKEREGDNGILYLVRSGSYSTYDELKKAKTIIEKANHHPLEIKQ